MRSRAGVFGAQLATLSYGTSVVELWPNLLQIQFYPKQSRPLATSITALELECNGERKYKYSFS